MDSAIPHVKFRETSDQFIINWFRETEKNCIGKAKKNSLHLRVINGLPNNCFSQEKYLCP